MGTIGGAPLGPISCGLLSTFYSLQISVWESLEIRVPWEHEIVSSNLTTLTAFPCHLMVRDRPVKPGMYVQPVPGELTGRTSQLAMAAVSKTAER